MPLSAVHPEKAPCLAFDWQHQAAALRLLGANCGPGAIAGMVGSTPAYVAKMMSPKLQKIKGTTETMLRDTLTDLGVSWHDTTPGWVEYGIVRIQFDGAWMHSSNPFAKYYESHWIGVCSHVPKKPVVFDINAIKMGGWTSLRDWTQHVLPRLLPPLDAGGTGGWFISDALEITLPLPEPQHQLHPCPLHAEFDSV